MYSLKLGHGTAVVLTDRRIIKQLMDKRASISSNRPRSYVSQDLVTENDHLLWMNNTPTWRVGRKLIHQDLTESLCEKEHAKIQHAETTQLLYDILETPDLWINHLKRFSNSIIMSIGKSFGTIWCLNTEERPSSMDMYLPSMHSLWDSLTRVKLPIHL